MFHHALPTAEEIAKLPPDGGRHFNRLIFEKSPYLLQHARNPVDWYPWGAEAFDRARAEGKPLLISLGYSTCHWCHQMARDTFEDKRSARLLNEHFIAIKVDREERPDLDEIYMYAAQLLTGAGGWPNNVWVTPEGQPWYVVGYLPAEDHPTHTGFRTLLTVLDKLWQGQRTEVDRVAAQVTTALRGGLQPHAEPVELTPDLVLAAVVELGARFDERQGGFSPAPKFPPHAALGLLLQQQGRRPEDPVRHMLTLTLDKMALGGIRDHVGGGFHRYALGGHWLVPHFEKMLYDNGQLARSYTLAFRLTGQEENRRVVEGICGWALREMIGPEGGLCSGLDAESEGEEGKFYVWRAEELASALGDDEAALVGRVFNAREDGNYRDEATGERGGGNVLYRAASWEELAAKEGVEEGELRRQMEADLEILRQRREERVRPHRDDKILPAWNGLMIGGLAVAGQEFQRPEWIAAAGQAAGFILEHMRPEGRLRHTYRDGEARIAAYLDDCACLAEGLLDLHEASGEGRWLEAARSLLETLLGEYRDAAGGFFHTAAAHEPLLVRPKLPWDDQVASGNAAAARALLRLGRLTGEARYHEAAEASLRSFSGLLAGNPGATTGLATALEAWLE